MKCLSLRSSAEPFTSVSLDLLVVSDEKLLESSNTGSKITSVQTYLSFYFHCAGMGESNCAWNRRSMLHRDTILAAAAIYKGESDCKREVKQNNHKEKTTTEQYKTNIRYFILFHIRGSNVNNITINNVRLL